MRPMRVPICVLVMISGIVEAEPAEDVVEHALLRQDQLPGEQPEDVAAPERQDREHEEEPLIALGHAEDDPHRQEVAEDHGEHAGGHRDVDRLDQRPAEARAAEELGKDVDVVADRELGDDLVVAHDPEAENDQERQRRDEEYRVVADRRRQERELERAPVGGGMTLPSVTGPPSSARRCVSRAHGWRASRCPRMTVSSGAQQSSIPS